MLPRRGQCFWLLTCTVLTVCLSGCTRPQQGGCATSTSSPAGRLQPVDRCESVEVAGIERTYWLHLPASYDSARPVPLVIVLHGEDGTAKRMAQITGFNALSDVEGFVVAYPEAFERHWNTGRASPEPSQIDDVRFLSKLIDQLCVLLNIDRKQVYAAGFSGGGILVQRLGCELSSKIAAIACVAGPLPKEMAEKCTPTQPVSVLMMHGTADESVPYSGGRVRGPVDMYVLSVAETIDRWLTADGCEDRTPAVTTLPTGIVVRCQSYTCSRGTAVMLYTIEGGGHIWPGRPLFGHPGPRTVSATSGDFDATRTIWEFFKTHPRS